MNAKAKAEPASPVEHVDFITEECHRLQKLLGMQAVSCRALGNANEADDAISSGDFAAAFSGIDELLTAVGERIEAISTAANELYDQYRELNAEKTGSTR
jgi:hypothetical protein